MPTYKILWKRSAVKELKSLPKDVINKILKVVMELAEQPLPAGTRKMAASEHSFRIRAGDYRIIYSIQSEILTIEIIRVGHRREIYR